MKFIQSQNAKHKKLVLDFVSTSLCKKIINFDDKKREGHKSHLQNFRFFSSISIQINSRAYKLVLNSGYGAKKPTLVEQQKMMNSLFGSMGSLKREIESIKSENSSNKPQTDCSDESSVSQLKKAPTLSDLEQNTLTPSSLNIPELKFEVVDGDIELRSPENSLWESFFSDQLDGDFMMSSPVRNIPSPQASIYNYNYNYSQSMHGQSLLGCSPPRFSSPLGPYKGKGLSPLNKVFINSPNNQFMQVESISLPSLENFLDDYEGQDNFLSYSAVKTSGAGSSSESYDTPTTVPALLDCLTLPNASRFCGPVSEGSVQGSSQMTHESDLYHQMGSADSAPLLQQLQQERQHEKQQQQQQRQPPQIAHPPQNTAHNLVVPLYVGPEQVKVFSFTHILGLKYPTYFNLKRVFVLTL